MVSLQRTARPVSRTPTCKKLACWTGPEGLAGDWRRRDVTNRRTHRERWKNDVEDSDLAGVRWFRSNQREMVELEGPLTTQLRSSGPQRRERPRHSALT